MGEDIERMKSASEGSFITDIGKPCKSTSSRPSAVGFRVEGVEGEVGGGGVDRTRRDVLGVRSDEGRGAEGMLVMQEGCIMICCLQPLSSSHHVVFSRSLKTFSLVSKSDVMTPVKGSVVEGRDWIEEVVGRERRGDDKGDDVGVEQPTIDERVNRVVQRCFDVGTRIGGVKGVFIEEVSIVKRGRSVDYFL